MEIKVTTDLAAEPVLLATAKNAVKASYGTDTTEDALITSMIKAARQLIERYCDRSLGQKTIQVFYHEDEVCQKRLILPAGPHSSITSVYRISQDGTETELTLNTGYYKRGNQFFELELLSSSISPWTEGAVTADDYRVTLVCGYGASGCETLPEAYCQAILKTVAEWYAFRENYTPQLSSEVRRILNRLTGNVYL